MQWFNRRHALRISDKHKNILGTLSLVTIFSQYNVNKHNFAYVIHLELPVIKYKADTLNNILLYFT